MRTVSRRRFLSLWAAAVAGGVVAACRPKTEVVEKIVEREKTVQVREVVTATPASARAPVEVVFRVWAAGDIYQSMVDMFNDSQGEVGATIEETPFNGYREKLLTEIAAGTSPDGAFVDGYWMPEFVDKKLLLALDEFMASDPNLSLDKYLPNTFLEGLQIFDGHTYGLPAGDSPKVIWYNVDVFSEAGVKTPLEWEAANQWDWSNFLSVCQQLAKGEGINKTYAYATWLTRADSDDIMRSFGGGWTDQRVKEVWTAKPGSAEGLQFLLDLYLKHKVCPLSQDAQALGGTGQMFNTRHLAMYMSGIWEVIWNSQAEGLRYDVAPLPKGPSGRYTFHKPNGAVIPVTTRDAQAAWKLVSFLQGPAVEKQMVQCKGWMPFLKESVETFLEKGCIPNAKLFVDTLVNGLAHALPVNKNGAKMDQIVADALGAALSSGKDAKWVIAQVEPQLQTLVG